MLIKRYKESRRKHPLAPEGRTISGISLERNILREVKEKADNIIDTSDMNIWQLREKMTKIYGEKDQIESQLIITILSFGFKYGIPLDSDLVFDVRFLPNPFYIPELKKFSGNDEPVRKYVTSFNVTNMFVDKLNEMLLFLIPNYIKEGKRQLIVSIGCTGGRHRSVTIANIIYEKLKQQGFKVNIEHRDIKEDVNRGGIKL